MPIVTLVYPDAKECPYNEKGMAVHSPIIDGAGMSHEFKPSPGTVIGFADSSSKANGKITSERRSVIVQVG